MPAIGMGMLWGGYTLILWGYCKLMGYDISIGQLVVPGKFKGKWPPPLIKDAPNPMGGKNHNGVPPGDHPGDMPWTYPHGGSPADSGGSGSGSGGSSSSGGGVMQV